MKKTFKVILSAVLALTMLLSVMSAYFVSAAETEPLSNFTVQAAENADSDKALGSLKWWYSEVDGKYYMFMPSSTDLSSVTVWFDAAGDVYCGDTKLENGQVTDVFANGGEYTLTAGSSEYKLVFLCTSGIPSIFINTESGSLDAIHADKEYKEKGTMFAIDENGNAVYNNTLDSIKGRGNSTWGMAKKPYNIKLSKSTNLFGMGKAKSWCLIANYEDHTLVRNQIVYGMGEAIGMTETPACLNVDVYINGEYHGVYLITEKVEIKENRVEIFDLEGATEDCNTAELDTYAQKGFVGDLSAFIEGTQRWCEIPNNPEDITGGYLLELELASRYPEEASGFVTNQGQPVVIKSPEYATEAQAKYISGYWQEMEDALYSETGYNDNGKHYSEYMDLVSFARQYIIEEWSGDWDAGITSNYFYKDINGKLHAGPVWDFDSAMANKEASHSIYDPFEWNARSRTLWYNSLMGSDTVKQVPNIYALCFRHADFIKEVEKQWSTSFIGAYYDLMNTDFDKYVMNVKDSAVMNCIRWNYYDTTDVNNILSKYVEETEYIREFLILREGFLDENLKFTNEPITIDTVPSQKYTGKAIEPDLTVRCVDLVLAEGEDYTVSYENNVEKGDATVTVIGIGEFEGRTAQTTFKIISINDPLNWTGGAGEERAKENLKALGAKFVDSVELICYYISKPFYQLADK